MIEKYKISAKLIFYFLSLVFIILFSSCEKIVDIKPPVNTVTTEQVFADSAQASAAILGIYAKLRGAMSNFANVTSTEYAGLSADELVAELPTEPFYANSLIANDITLGFWSGAYGIIYQTNACIEGLNNSKSISSSVRAQFIAEAKFIRALSYFYLVNFFGEVPCVKSTGWEKEAKIPKSSIPDLYEFIINDLKDAQQNLQDDYSISNNDRVRANKPAANALIARVYLYTEKWAESVLNATKVISDISSFSLNSDLDQVFYKNNSEAILQWSCNIEFPPFNGNLEGNLFNPRSPGDRPGYEISTWLLNSFEAGDLRKTSWVSTVTFFGTLMSYPYKYKLSQSQSRLGYPITELYTVLRVAEQYLIRAEANAYLNNLEAAINDLNVIRRRAELADLPLTLNQTQVLAAIEQERRVELFCEWGHRWFDLKRTKRIDAVMSVITPLKNGGTAWSSYQQLYPIPMSELRNNPFLTQSPGY